MPKKLKCIHPAPGIGLSAGDVETFDNARAAELLAPTADQQYFVLEADLGDDVSDAAPEGEAYNAELTAQREAAAKEAAAKEAEAKAAADEAAKKEAAEKAAAEKAAKKAPAKEADAK